MRRLFVLGSLSGAPGVTTTALALAAAWPQAADGGVRPIIVETSVWGGDLATRCGTPYTPGLLEVAATARQDQPGSLLGAVAQLPSSVRAVVAPAGRGACAEAVRVLATENGRRVLTGDVPDQGSVLLDVGRIGEDVSELLGAADRVMLVTRGCPEALTHVYAHLLSAGEQACRAVLVVVGPCAFPRDEIARALGIEDIVLLPWDAKGVAELVNRRRGAPRTSGFRATRLLTATHRLACRLTEDTEPTGGAMRLRAASTKVPRQGAGV